MELDQEALEARRLRIDAWRQEWPRERMSFRSWRFFHNHTFSEKLLPRELASRVTLSACASIKNVGRNTLLEIATLMHELGHPLTYDLDDHPIRYHIPRETRERLKQIAKAQ